MVNTGHLNQTPAKSTNIGTPVARQPPVSSSTTPLSSSVCRGAFFLALGTIVSVSGTIVYLERAGGEESPVAGLAVVWPLVRMYPLVLSEVAAVAELFSAHLRNERGNVT